MEILDGHMHILDKSATNREQFRQRLGDAGVYGGIITSLPPKSFEYLAAPTPPKERLENLFWWIEATPNLYPFYWLDPTDNDAIDQVNLAIQRGVMGFKIICDHFYPSEERAMRIYENIALTGKPIDWISF